MSTQQQGFDPVVMTGEVLEISAPAVDEPKVSKGWQTWIGYGASALSAGVAAFIEAAGTDLPPYFSAVLIAVAGALAAITGRNRSDQVRAMADANARVQAASIAAAAPGRPVNVELTDSMPSEIHPPSV